MEESTETIPLTKTITNLLTGQLNKTTKHVAHPTVPLNFRADITKPLEALEGFPVCVLLTGPIIFHETDNYTVENIEFVISSNDQGWCNEDNFEGVYEGSWTWFEVAILRLMTKDEDGIISPRDKRSINSEPCIKQTLDKKNISDKQLFVINAKSGNPFWHLQRNRRGRDAAFQHTIKWSHDSKESASERLGWEFNSKTGAGSGVSFVHSLQKGDRIAVIARAKQSGSVNYVSEVDIHIEGFKPSNDTLTAGSTKDLPSSVQTNTAGHFDNSGSDAATVPVDPAAGERQKTTSAIEPSNLRVNIANETAEPSLGQSSHAGRGGAPSLPQSPTSNEANSSFPTHEQRVDARAQPKDREIQRTFVEGEPHAPSSDTDLARQTITFKPSAHANVGNPNDNVGPPVSSKIPDDPRPTGAGGNGKRRRLTLPGRKKRSISSVEVNPTTVDNSMQAQAQFEARVPVGTSQSKVVVNDQEAKLTRKDSTVRAQSDLPARPSRTIRFKTWGQKVISRIKGETASTNPPGNKEQVGDSEAGGKA